MTLGARMARRDQAAFVGRRQELAELGKLFVGDPSASVVLLHGPGGIGKSTLLREFERRGRDAGWTPVPVEGRDLPPVPDALEAALAPARAADRPLLLLDTYERMTALGGYLRRGLLPSLPDRAIVVIAGRGAPDRGWFEGGWETLVMELELGPLSGEEAHELLAGHGLRGRRADELVAWAGGSPLALSLAADAAGLDADWTPSAGEESPELVRTLVRRLAESELDQLHRDVLGVACIARVTTVDLLRAVLPDVDPEEAIDWLGRRTFAEPLADGVTLHELVRRALRGDLRQREPERERELRRRIADSLHERAVKGRRLLLTVDLAELVESPVIRAFYGWDGSVRNRVDVVRPGDAEQVALLLSGQGDPDWWELTRPFFRNAPGCIDIARDAGDALCGYSISVTPSSAPPIADEDPLLGPWLEHAREHAPDGNAILWQAAIDFTRDPSLHVQAMVCMAGVLRSGLDNPRYAYLPIDSRHGGAHGFAEAVGARHIEELDVEAGGHLTECYLLDYGRGGLLGMQREYVYRELGLALAPPDAEAVRDALRNLRVPHALARSRLASGHTPEERAASVRGLIEDAVDQAFGATENEQLLRRVLVHGYLDPASNHEQAAHDLNLSRAAYFRRLKQASERVAEYLAQGTSR
jgi:hypothetical protein